MLNYNLPVPDVPSHHVLDASKINCFMSCPRQFFYQYILGWRSEKPNNHLIFGTAWHLAMEHLLLHGFDTNSVLGAYDAFERSYRLTFPPETDEIFFPKTPERAFEAIATYAANWKRDLDIYEPLYTEVAFSVQMDEERSLSGRMDSILLHKESGKIESLEHKTAGSSFNWTEQWDLAMQGGLYTHALMCLYGFEKIRSVVFNGTVFKKVKGSRGGEKFEFIRKPVVKSKNMMQTWYTNTLYWMDQIETEYQLLSNSSASDDVLKAFPMNTCACSKYNGCAYKDFCMAWKNPLQHCDEPPIGMIAEHWNPLTEKNNVTMQLSQEAEPIITSTEETNEPDNERTDNFTSL